MSLVRVWARHGKTFGALVGITATFAVAISSPAEAARRKSAPRAGGYAPPYATIVVDAKTGKVLQSENEDAPRIPASLTKVMSLYLLFEQLDRGKLRLDTPLTVSSYAAAQPPTKLGLRPGSTIDVEDAIKSMVTLSANDASVVVAENIAGSEEAFAEMMTRKARALGMSSSTFYNANGLPNSPPNITTARDLATLGRAIQDRFPKYFAYFSTRSFQYGQRTVRGHNRLLGKIDGVDGIKTGYTRLSGFNLLTSVNTEARSVVAVVLGGRSGGSRDQQMAALIGSNLPRAYAGARIAPPVGEGSRPTLVADASPQPIVAVNVETTAATTPAPVKVASATPTVPVTTPAPVQEPRKPLDLNSLRPVVASATGASSTTTPSSTLRWQKSQEPLPLNAQAYAALQAPVPAARPAPVSDTLASKEQERVPASAPARGAAKEAKREAPRPNVTEWVIQLGASDDEDKAKGMLDTARARVGKLLAKAAPFTQKVSKDGSTLYRARFSGFNESGDAEKACKALKRSGFACFATRS
jgi:D-alanyl-D-alanine carboxypeptidase